VLYDLANLGIGEDFLYEVGGYLLPGRAAVVAEMWEEWTLPVDTRMEALGGIVFRRMRGEILDAQIERDVAALDAELAELEAESDQATEEAKARLQARSRPGLGYKPAGRCPTKWRPASKRPKPVRSLQEQQPRRTVSGKPSRGGHRGAAVSRAEQQTAGQAEPPSRRWKWGPTGL
jgi:hypothetical protein